MPHNIDVKDLTAQTILEQVELFKSSDHFFQQEKYFTTIEGDTSTYSLRTLNINKSMIAVLLKTLTCKQISFLHIQHHFLYLEVINRVKELMFYLQAEVLIPQELEEFLKRVVRL